MLLLKYLVVQSLTWALECDRPQRRRSVLLQVLEVDRDEGWRLTRCTRRSKFDEASSNVLVNRQDQLSCISTLIKKRVKFFKITIHTKCALMNLLELQQKVFPKVWREKSSAHTCF